MKGGFYIRLAKDGIVKNRKFYFPYILTCICMIMMFYIVTFLYKSEALGTVRGGEMLRSLLGVGQFIVALFALIFLYYTNSFLIRRRQKEFGLYNILGMGKRNLVKILIWENLITAAVSLVLGLLCGVLFSKLTELAAVKMLSGTAGFGIRIEKMSVLLTVVLFLAIFTLIMIRMLVSIYRLRPVELLRSESVGEKPPKANWVLALIGLALLGGAYYLAVAILDPVAALAWFFNAVFMVIVATYLLFIAGSVVMCRALQKNKNYYYKTKHFVSVASMAYRMKRNGAGLASICILSTMVLVTVSSTVCMYALTDDTVEQRYPRDISISMYDQMTKAVPESKTAPYIEAISQVLSEYGETAQDVQEYSLYRCYLLQEEDCFVMNMYEADANGTVDYNKMRDLYFITLDDYNRITGEARTLADDELLLYPQKGDYEYDTITLEGLGTWKAERIDTEPVKIGTAEANMRGSLLLVVKDLSLIEQVAQYEYDLAMEYGGNFGRISMEYGFNLDCGDERQMEIYDDIFAAVAQAGTEQPDLADYMTDCKAQGRADNIGIYGGLLFLGILLGGVFLFGTVLIMYYKQISEGYEDQNRFDILMKVGMTKKEVKKSINSQVLTVFFLPLIMAGVHLGFAFPLISKIMMLMTTSASRELLLFVTICCYFVFALFYVIVYGVTSKSYYTIISAKRNN